MLTKQLLQDFEASGYTRQEFGCNHLHTLCSNQAQVYGEVGSVIRRQTQQRWNIIKRKDDKNYTKYLQSFEVKPGKRQEQESKNTEPQESTNTEPQESTNTEPPVTTADTTTMSHTSTAGNESKPAAMTAPSTPYSSSQGVPLLPMSPVPSTVYASPAPLVRHNFGQASSLGGGQQLGLGLSWSSFQEGSLLHPFIVRVNDCPKRNPPFKIQYVPDLSTGSGEFQGFDISMSCPVQDYKDWDAKTPPLQNFPPEFMHRLVLIKGPSLPFWLKDTDKYHASKKKNCAATKKQHSTTQQAIADEEERKLCYYLIVFSEARKLDNQIFGNGIDLPIEINPITCKASENAFKKDLLGMTLSWKIGVAGSGKKVGPTTAKPSESDLF